MAFQTWQVGLDIQNGQLCALGIQRRRHGWQLRHWWQHSLPQDTLSNGVLQRPEPVITLLQCWRKQLPYRISLRVGFPPQSVLQRYIPLPATQLREPARTSYITAAARRFFPVDLQELSLDYRQAAGTEDQLCLTATRREALHSWLHCLAAARLKPHVVELTPAALCVLSGALSINTAAVLIHRLSDHWLWFCADRQPCWGWSSLDEAPDMDALQQLYFPGSSEIYYSSALETPLPLTAQWLDPLAAFSMKQPPLPLLPGAFSLAVGLALRPEDVG